MPILQMRLTDDQTLQGLVAELAEKIERVLPQEYEGTRWKDGMTVIKILRVHLRRNIRAYGICGERSFCHTNVKNVPWKSLAELDRWIPYCPPGRQRILLFDLRHGLAQFYIDLESDLFAALSKEAPSRVWVLAKRKIEDALRSVFGPCLYENPACNGCPLCRPNTWINPWTEKQESLR